MEIYEETHESIAHKLSQMKASNAKETTIPEGTDDDDALDMFMDSAKSKEESKEEGKREEEDAVVAPSMDDEVRKQENSS